MKIVTAKKLVLPAIVLILFSVNNCKKDKSLPAFEIKLVSSSGLGQYLVDRNGYTLYSFANDAAGRTSCVSGCASLWPYFYDANLTPANLDPTLNFSDFDTILVNGVPQMRYKGWPLYYYAPVVAGVNVREAIGQTGGDGFNNVWFVAKPDYSIALANTQLVGSNGQNYVGNDVPGTGKTLYFTNPLGVTLYYFTKDSASINKFTKPDFSNNPVWPIYETTNIMVPSILDKSLFTMTSVYGRSQLTYKGWPLYYFGQDNQARGNNKGVSFPTPGIWLVATKDMPFAPQR